MTRDELLANVDEGIDRAAEGMRKTARRLVDSGALDYSNERPDQYYTSKAVLCAALRNEATQWRPLGGETATERNLMHY